MHIFMIYIQKFAVFLELIVNYLNLTWNLTLLDPSAPRIDFGPVSVIYIMQGSTFLVCFGTIKTAVKICHMC